MTKDRPPGHDAARNVALYPWYQFFRNLLFWQAIWFLYFQDRLSAADAILLYALYDIGTTALEVPSGYMSDRLGRRLTLVASALTGLAGAALLGGGTGFALFAAAQVLLGASTAFNSGTDSALLFESLAAAGRAEEIEAHELRAWRFSFSALAVSALTGGLMAQVAGALPFLASALAFLAVLAITLCFREPPHRPGRAPAGAVPLRMGALGAAFRQRVLLWLFALSVLMYGFSHIPFVFGQPFILQALDTVGLAAGAPLVSGATSAAMMLVSVAASLGAGRLRARLGLGRILLLAFALQVALTGALAMGAGLAAIAVLLLRMVPSALSHPFILARVQPLLDDEARATYLSLQSFCGRLLFAGSLWLASLQASAVDVMGRDELRLVLVAYCAAGACALVALALAARRVPLDPP